MTLVIDASVAVKWFVEERGSSQARDLLNRDEELIAPELVVAEVCNALWRHTETARIDGRQAELAALRIGDLFHSLWRLQPLVPRALTLARLLHHPVYDCFYLALAEDRDARLITDDRRLFAIASGSDLAPRVAALIRTP